MGTVQVCLGRKASSRPISPRTQIAPAKETPRDLAAVPERATSPAKVVWESRRENTSRDSRKGDRVNGSTKTRGSVRAHIKDSGGNTVRPKSGHMLLHVRIIFDSAQLHVEVFKYYL